MNKSKIFFVIVMITLGFITIVKSISSHKFETCYKVTKSNTVLFMTTDALVLEANYKWYFNQPSDEFDHSCINSIINNTIQNFFIEYSYDEFLNNQDMFIEDLSKKIENCVSVLYPFGFDLINITINN